MGCVTATAKRRRKQACNGFKHLPPRMRPRFKVRTTEAADRHEARIRDRQLNLRVRSRKVKG